MLDILVWKRNKERYNVSTPTITPCKTLYFYACKENRLLHRVLKKCGISECKQMINKRNWI